MPSRSEYFDQLSETQKRGQATEAILKMEFTLRDIPVLVPEYDNEPYDFVIEFADSTYKIQAKTAYRHSDGTVRFETVSTRARSEGYERDGYEGLIDYFAVYNPVLDEIYLVGIDEASSGKMEIRFREPANNQQAGINWHTDFVLDHKLNEIRS